MASEQNAWEALTAAEREALLKARDKYPYTGVIDDERNMAADSPAKAYGDQEPWPEISSRAPPEVWNRVRSEFPALQERTDAELAAANEAYVNEPASLKDVLLKTPIGPVIVINAFLLVSGFSWCDTPFGSAASCAPP